MKARTTIAAIALLACGISEGEPKQGASTMTGFFTPQTVTSAALPSAYALQCTATPAGDKPSGAVPAGGFPSLYERSLELTTCTAVHGSSKLPAKVMLTGYTQLAAAQRADDPRDATLTFDSQRLFDRPWPAEFSVLVIVGEPAVAAAMGANSKPPLLSGVSAPVRAFALIGADASLATASRQLVGWTTPRKLEATRAALHAGHPLVALDAMRVAIQDASIEAIALSARELLHPSQPSAVRASAIEMLGDAIANARPGSPEAEQLIEAALVGWELEQRTPVESTYVRSLTKAAPQLRASRLRDRARTVGNSASTSDLAAAQKALSSDLK
jgi:hypothetical protein